MQARGYCEKTKVPFGHPGGLFLHQEGSRWPIPPLVPKDLWLLGNSAFSPEFFGGWRS